MSIQSLHSGQPYLCQNRLVRFGISALAAIAALLLAATPLAAHEPSVPKLPSNTDCEQFAVLVKASVTEDRAAANMLAEALRLRSGDRCLLDVADGVAVGMQIDSGEVTAGRQVVFVVGGSAAISAELLMALGIDRAVRVSGADRWATQRAVVQIVWNLGGDEDYLPEAAPIQVAGSAPKQAEDATEAELWDWAGWGHALDGFAGSARSKQSGSGKSELIIGCSVDANLSVAIATDSGRITYAEDGSGGLYINASYRVGPVGSTVSEGARWRVRTAGTKDLLFMPTSEHSAFIAAVRSGLIQGHTSLHGLFWTASSSGGVGEWSLEGWEREVEQVLRGCGH